MEVREGALFGFLGANGAGKTTTMRMILDLFRPDSGQITWNGSEVRQVPRKNWAICRRSVDSIRKCAWMSSCCSWRD